MSDDLRSAALEYANQGIAIMPCAERGKKPALDRTGKEHAVATNDTDQILQWWTKNPQSNIGIACTANRLAVIDIDGEAGIEWIREHQMPMPTTAVAITARGFHYYYRWPEDDHQHMPDRAQTGDPCRRRLRHRPALGAPHGPRLSMGATVAGPGDTEPCLTCHPNG